MSEAAGVPGAHDARGHAPRPPWPVRSVGLAALLALLGLFALLALAAPASAHHTNPACAGGAFNQTWQNLSGGDFELLGHFEYWNDCILVRSNLRLIENETIQSTLRLHDVRMVFDNDLGNFSVRLENSTVWEMTDLDRNASTPNDGSRLEILNGTNRTSGFWFDAARNSSVYINDTSIIGGGFAGNGLTRLSGLFFDGLMDFGWNRVDHTTFANGLLLLNFTIPRSITDYSVVGAGNGVAVYLRSVGNLSFVNLTTRSTPLGVVAEESQDLSFRNLLMAHALTAFKATRVWNLSITSITDAAHRTVGLDFERVVNLTLRAVRLTPAGANNSAYGIELDNSRDIRIENATVSNHGMADLHIINQTQNLLVQNATIQGPVTQVTPRGIWAVVTADVFNPSNFTFVNVNITGRDQGVALDGAVGVLFQNTSITATITDGLEARGCANVRFANGSIQYSQGPGAHLDGSNLTIETTLIQQNVGPGVRLGDAGFTLDRVIFQFNGGGSVRSFGAVRLSPSAILSSSLVSASGADAVNITGIDLSAFSRLLVVNSTFVNFTAGGGAFALHLTTIGLVEVFNNTFGGLPVAVFSSGTLHTTGNTYRLQGLSAASVVILFDGGRELEVVNETFVNPPLAPVSTAIRAPGLIAEAQIVRMRLPRADFGIWLSGVGLDQSTATVLIDNVTLDAVRDGISILGIRSVSITNVTVLRSRVAINLIGGGDGETLSVANSTLQASWTALSFATDSGGNVVATDIALNLSAGGPGNGTVVRGGAVVTLARIMLDGVDFGIDILDARRVFLTGQNFTHNRIGLALNASGAITSTALNWTVDTPTLVKDSSLRLIGDIHVLGVPLTLDNAFVSVYALVTEPNRVTRFFMEGASTLILLNGSRIVTEPANGSQIHDSRFTVQMSATSRLTASSPAPWPHITLEGLGDLGSLQLSEQGILLRAQDTTITRVDFLNASRGLIADGVNLTVSACNFTGIPGSGAAVTVIGRGTPVWSSVSGVRVFGMDGVNATSANVTVAQSSFDSVGSALELWNANGWLGDSFVGQSSFVVWAHQNSYAEVHSVTATSLGTAYIAEGSSALDVYASTTNRFAQLARASGGGSITFYNPLVDKVLASGASQQYPVQTVGGSVRVFWTVRFAVQTQSDSLNASGASVEIADGAGTPRFSGLTDASGYTIDVLLLEFSSAGGAETYASPWNVLGSLRNLVARLSLTSPVAPFVVLLVDDLPPVIVLGVVPFFDNATRLREWTISGSAYDDYSGLVPRSPCVAFNEGACVFYGNPFEAPFTLGEGPNSFRIEARDLFGNLAALWFNFTRDLTPPSIVECTPGFTFITRDETVDLVCQLAGGGNRAAISGVLHSLEVIDGVERVHSILTLSEGPVSFQLSISDALGNFDVFPFIWKRDTQAPKITLAAPPPGITAAPGVALSGTVESDAVQMTFTGAPLPFPAYHFTVLWNLTEGANEATFTATDSVGNTAFLNVTIVRDSTTNCSVATPRDGATTPEGRITIGGTCDPDVSLLVGDSSPVHPSSDSSWSVWITLREGANAIHIRGEDPHGALFDVEVHVYYARGGSTSDITLLVIFGLLAGGTFALAFFISRRPRKEDFAEAPRSMTASQKAPPRPKPPTLKLPETPDDQTFTPRAPPPPGR